MKKYWKVGAFLLAMALLGGLVSLINTLTGYPFSYFVVKHSLDTYMEEHYADTDFVVGKPEHSLKLGGFTVEVHSPSSPDTHFSMHFYMDGSLDYDGYDTHVKSGFNTAKRLSSQYKELCKTIFDSANFPFDATCEGSFEDAMSGDKAVLEEPGSYPEQWEMQALKPDASYDIFQLSGSYGTIILTVTTDAVTLQTAENALLELRRIMEQANLPFQSVELWLLSSALNDHGTPAETMHILNVPWEDIRPEGCTEALQRALDATTAYYH